MMKKLTPNEGTFDRVVRLLLAVLIAGVAAYTGWWWLLIFSAILLFTAITGFCGLYTLLGINTCKMKKTSETAVAKEE